MGRLLITSAVLLLSSALMTPGYYSRTAPDGESGQSATAHSIYSIGAKIVKKPKSPDCPAFIAGVFPKSPAENAGLRVGDQLYSVNGASIATLTDATSRLRDDAPLSPSQLKLIRDGTRLMRTIHRRPATEIDAAAAPFWSDKPVATRNLADGKVVPGWVPDRYADCFR